MELKYQGNIDIDNRQVIRNENGSISTESSFSTNIDGKEVVLPTIVNGKRVSEDKSVQHYFETGENLGKFDTVPEAESYANNLHLRQEKFYDAKYDYSADSKAGKLPGKDDFFKIPGADYTEKPITDFFTEVIDPYASISKQLGDGPIEPTLLEFDLPFQAAGSLLGLAGSIRFTPGISSLKKTRDAKKLWDTDSRFKQGVTDHVNAKDRELFENNERGYFDDISGQIKSTHNVENGEPIFRGVRLEPGNEYQKMQPGDYISSNQVESFSHDRKVAERFGTTIEGTERTDQYLFTLVDRQGGVDLPKISGHNAWGESEVAMPANAKYEILDKWKEDGFTHMSLGESQTVPKGAKLHIRDGTMEDFTDVEAIEFQMDFVKSRIDKFSGKMPTISASYEKTLKRLKSDLAQSQEAREGL